MSRFDRVAASLAVVATLTHVSRALADDRSTCVDAFESAQRLRAEKAYVEARKSLLACVQPSCPAPMVRECSSWLAEVNASLPSIVLGASDAHGRDLDAVTVTLDGRVVSTHLDGKAVEVDPGPHELRFAHAGAPTIDQRVVVREGEKNRLVRVAFPDPTATTATPAPEAERAQAGLSPATYVLAGLTLLAAGSFAYFGLTATSEASDARRCEQTPGCNNVAIRSRAIDHARVADISLAVGAVALAGTGLTFALGR